MNKTILIFLFAILCSLSGFAQLTFQKSFGGASDNEWQFDLKKMQQSGYLITGATDNFGAGNFDAYCIRLDNKGDMLWSKTYGTNLPDSKTRCYGTKDKGFLAAFTTSTKAKDRDSGLVVLKCDVNGNVQWSKVITDNKMWGFSAAYLYEDKKGNFYVLYGSGGTITLVKLTTSGDITWSSVIDTKPLHSFEGELIAEVGNNILVGGESYGDNWITYGSFIHLFVFDEHGEIKTCKRICAGGCYNENYLSIANIVVSNDSIYVNATYTPSDDYRTYTCWFTLPPESKAITAGYVEYTSMHTVQYLVNKQIIRLKTDPFRDASIKTYAGYKNQKQKAI